jgi:hypothetical protein
VAEPGDFIVYEGPLASLIIMHGDDDQPHMSRMLQPMGIRSDHFGRALSEQEVLGAAVHTLMGHDAAVPDLPDQMTARAFLHDYAFEFGVFDHDPGDIGDLVSTH